MFNRKQPSLPAIQDLTGEHLREADKLVRLKRYDEALLEIENAYKIDPNNMNTRSFLERTRFLIDKEHEKRSQVFGEFDTTSEHRMDVLAELFAAVEKFIQEKKYPKALNELAKVYRIDPKNYYAQAFSDRIVTLMRAETAAHKAYKAQTLQFSASDSDTPSSEKANTSVPDDVPIQPANIQPSQITQNSKQQFESDASPLAKPITLVLDDVPVQSSNIQQSRTTLNGEQQLESDAPPLAKPITLVLDDVPVQSANIQQSRTTPNGEKQLESDAPPLAKRTTLVLDDVPVQYSNIQQSRTTLNGEKQLEPDALLSVKPLTPVHDDEPIQSVNILPLPEKPNSDQYSESNALPSAKPITPVHVNIPMHHATTISTQFAPYNEQQEELRRFALYRELLKECWADGVITPEESDMLHRARIQYAISFDTHCRIEVDIKIDAYVDALRIVWLDGVVNDNEQEVLEIMRRKYGITLEEEAAAEKQFSALLRSKQANAMILIVDSDYNNSMNVARALISYGYDVKIERHPEDALHFMNTHVPDLILSEAVFPELDTDGFELFQRTRGDERLSQIPFLLMINADDARMTRAGLRMGVDYIIPKPLHMGYMVSIVEGKLKTGMKNNRTEVNNYLEKNRKRVPLC